MGHVFGNRQQNIQNALSKQSGVNASSVSKILKITASVIMGGGMGKQQRQTSVRDTSGLTNMSNELISGNFHNNKQSINEYILDADNDGSIVDDVAGEVLGKRNNGLGGLLGKLFNKK